MKWQLRKTPLPVSGALAPDSIKNTLIKRLLTYPEGNLRHLYGGLYDGGIIVLGKSDLIPWISGMIYLGSDDLAPSILLPTNLKPELPMDLLQKKILSDHGNGRYAIDHKQKMIIPIRKTLPLSRTVMEAQLQ